MTMSSYRNSVASLGSAVCLLAQQAKAAKPEIQITKGNAAGPFAELTVKHDTSASTIRMQFSDDLKVWREAADCGCLEKTGTSLDPTKPGRMLTTFAYNPEISVGQRFFRAVVVGSPSIEYRLHGLNFSPYMDPDENPNRNVTGQITEAELRERIGIIAPYTEWIRSFGTNADLQPIGSIAHEMGLKAAVGAWIGRDLDQNRLQIDSLVALAIRGDVDLAIVGSETLLRGDVSAARLIGYLTEVRSRLRSAGVMIPVGTADVYGSFLNNPEIFAAVDVVLPNIYPFWEGLGVDCAVAYLNRSYLQLKAAAGDLPIIISETGWPTAGDRRGEAVPSVENAVAYLHTFISWAQANNVDYWAFSTFDEGDWKIPAEGEVGVHWGIWDRAKMLKPGMEVLFSGETLSPDHWLNCASDIPVIDVFSSPAVITTNLENFLVSGVVDPGEELRINGTPLAVYQMNESGSFAAIVPLSAGVNSIEIAVYSAGSAQPAKLTNKTVLFDPNFSTADKRLLYVDVVDVAGATPSAPGTVVIDLDGNSILGIMPGRHVRGVADNSGEIYMSNLQILSTTSHVAEATLPFSVPLEQNNFLVAGQALISGNQIVDVATNTLRANPLPTTIRTGSSWASAPIPGGPASSPDGSRVFCGNDVNAIDLASNTLTPTGFSASFMSDITVSPDNRLIAVSGYSYGNGYVSFYDAETYNFLGEVGGLGDFNGEVEFVGSRAIVGSSGNPSYGGGYVSVIDTDNFTLLSQLRSPLADNLAVSPGGEIFSPIGLMSDGILPARQGVAVWVVSDEGEQKGKLRMVKTFFLGCNRWVSTTGKPSYDQIRDIVYKPASNP